MRPSSALRILALQDPTLHEKLRAFQKRLHEEALAPLQNPDYHFDQPLL